MPKVKNKIIYPELSYKIIGLLYDVFNHVGAGHKEQYYQNAIKIAFQQNNLKFQEQVLIPLKYQNKNIGRYFLDFLIEDKIILEIKKTAYSANLILSRFIPI